MRQYAPIIITVLLAWSVTIQFADAPLWLRVVSVIATVMSVVLLIPQFIEALQRLLQMLPTLQQSPVPPVESQREPLNPGVWVWLSVISGFVSIPFLYELFDHVYDGDLDWLPFLLSVVSGSLIGWVLFRILVG